MASMTITIMKAADGTTTIGGVKVIYARPQSVMNSGVLIVRSAAELPGLFVGYVSRAVGSAPDEYVYYLDDWEEVLVS